MDRPSAPNAPRTFVLGAFGGCIMPGKMSWDSSLARRKMTYDHDFIDTYDHDSIDIYFEVTIGLENMLSGYIIEDLLQLLDCLFF